MTVQEGQKVIEELKAQGNSEEEIAGSFYLLFKDNKINVEQLEGLVNLLGYHLTDEFKAMDTEQQKTQGYELLDEEDNNEGQEDYQDNDGKEEGNDGNDNPAPANEGNKEEDEEKEAMNLFERKDGSANAPKEEEDSNEDEEKEAMKLFGKMN